MKKTFYFLVPLLIIFLLLIVFSFSFAVHRVYATGTISGTVFIDTNSNGVFDNTESPYLGGSAIKLYQNGSLVASTLSSTTDGTYSFSNLSGSGYVVSSGVPSGRVPTTPNPNNGSFTSPVNFGIISPGSAISGGTGYGLTQVGSYVWVVGSTQISVYNTDGTSTGTTYTGNGLCIPEGIAFVNISSTNKQVWVVNQCTAGLGSGSDATVSRFNTDGTSAGSAIDLGISQFSAWGIANVNIAGTHYVWVSGNTWAGVGTLIRLNTDGTSAGSNITHSGMTEPTSLLEVPNGSTREVWVSDTLANGIFVFDTSGNYLSEITTNNLDYPWGICYSPSGTQIWVVNQSVDQTNEAGSISAYSSDHSTAGRFTGINLNGAESCASVTNGSSNYVWVNSGYQPFNNITPE